MTQPLSRREFLAQSAGFGAGVALTPASDGLRKLIPYISPPEDIRPGTWGIYPTACRECPAGCGLHLRHRDGRVTKAEGNPDHPLSRGGVCARGQSCLQGLYDPDRLRQPLGRTGAGASAAAWPAAVAALAGVLRTPGRRVAILASLQTGALAEVLAAFAQAFDSDRVLYFEPVTYDALPEAHDLLFGRHAIPDFRLDGSDLILSLGADFLDTWLSPVQFTRRFADLHAAGDRAPGRLVYAGPCLSLTAGNADDFLCVAPGDEWRVGAALLNALLRQSSLRGDARAVQAVVQRLGWDRVAPPAGFGPERLRALAQALAGAAAPLALGGAACGGGDATRAALAAALLNAATGMLGRTMDFTRTHALGRAAAQPAVTQFLQALGPQDVLFVLDANPAFARPADVDRLRAAGTLVYLGTQPDETAALADWTLPLDAPLEAWGDYEPLTGVHTLSQPTMQRLHATRHAGDILLDLARAAGRPLRRGAAPPPDFHAWLQARWRELLAAAAPAAPFDTAWHDALQRGGLWTAPPPAQPPALKTEIEPAGLSPATAGSAAADGTLGLWLRPAVMLFDGRVANRGWLQEAPDPVSTLVWGSCVELHPDTARRLGIRDGEALTLRNAHGAVTAPARVAPDVAPDTAGFALGQGHTALGRNAAGQGANGFALLGAPLPGGPFGRVTVTRGGRAEPPIYLSASQQQFDRRIVQWTAPAGAPPADAEPDEPFALPLPEDYDAARDLYPPHAHPQHRWAMAADLQRCTGCGACAVACYAENNVAVAGRRDAGRGREMAWLKVVPYRAPDDARRIGWLPLMCQHCDAAPCEPVCPVFAAVHTEEGLNAQVYNRCVGTRYCSHNCPYKVRRFNWWDNPWAAPLDLQLNPDVTVRRRGVMEKCTFCVQRIRAAAHQARREGRAVRDGEVQPACVQSCPARALVFGDLLDPQSAVSALTRHGRRRYHVLEELRTRPAVTYLRRLAPAAYGGAGPAAAPAEHGA